MSFQINPALPQIIWLDLNSAFATTEQQACPSLRHRPVGVTNRISPNCCIITASYEAKAQGVHTGMRRIEALRRCPGLILVEKCSCRRSEGEGSVGDHTEGY
jgi:DNA polymerase IV